MKLIPEDDKAAILEAYVHLDLNGQSLDAPKEFRDGTFSFSLYYYRDRIGDKAAVELLDKTISQAINYPSISSYQLKDAKITIEKIVKEGTKWASFRISVLKEVKQISNNLD